jgi:hypothetical protein
MEKKLVNFFKEMQIEFNQEDLLALDQTKILEILFKKGTGKTKLTLGTKKILPTSLIEKIEAKFKQNDLNLAFKLIVRPEDSTISLDLVKAY